MNLGACEHHMRLSGQCLEADERQYFPSKALILHQGGMLRRRDVLNGIVNAGTTPSTPASTTDHTDSGEILANTG